MYEDHGGAPGAGVVIGTGQIHGREVMVVANDATVKAGARSWQFLTTRVADPARVPEFKAIYDRTGDGWVEVCPDQRSVASSALTVSPPAVKNSQS